MSSRLTIVYSKPHGTRKSLSRRHEIVPSRHLHGQYRFTPVPIDSRQSKITPAVTRSCHEMRERTASHESPLLVYSLMYSFPTHRTERWAMTKREEIERMRQEANARVWHVPCPRDYCGAQVGEDCRSSMGNPTWPHMPRRERAGEFNYEADEAP